MPDGIGLYGILGEYRVEKNRKVIKATLIKIVSVDVELDDPHGCITATHQCGPCAFNQVCSQSVRATYNEASASDWLELDPNRLSAELKFD